MSSRNFRRFYRNSLLFRPENFRLKIFRVKKFLSRSDRPRSIYSFEKKSCIIIFVQIIFVLISADENVSTTKKANYNFYTVCVCSKRAKVCIIRKFFAIRYESIVIIDGKSVTICGGCIYTVVMTLENW